LLGEGGDLVIADCTKDEIVNLREEEILRGPQWDSDL